MPSYNSITVVGHLGQDPELRYTPQGTPICSFTLAVNNRKKIENEWTNVAIWFKVKVWGKQAEPVSQYLAKGRSVLVAGQLDVETWTNRESKEVTTLVINASSVQFLGESGAGGDHPQNTTSEKRPRAAAKTPSAATPQPEISDDDIPF